MLHDGRVSFFGQSILAKSQRICHSAFAAVANSWESLALVREKVKIDQLLSVGTRLAWLTQCARPAVCARRPPGTGLEPHLMLAVWQGQRGFGIGWHRALQVGRQAIRGPFATPLQAKHAAEEGRGPSQGRPTNKRTFPQSKGPNITLARLCHPEVQNANRTLPVAP